MHCIINPQTNKLHRVTFSLSLAKHIIAKHFPHYEIRDAKAIRNKVLNKGEISSGIYGVVSTKSNLLLRAPLRKELADMYSECDSRHIEEIFLKFKD